MMLLALILAFVGGAVGSMCRFWLSGVIAQQFGETFPYGTLTVNVLGSWVIGFAAGWLVHHDNVFWASAAKVLVTVGFCGGLTTFSSFGLQTWNLILSERWMSALVNIFGSTSLCLGAVALGWELAQRVF
jgi:fluoride exporter